MRILHFSDIHVATGLRTEPWFRFANKRLLALGNLRLSRARRFRHVHQKVEALQRFFSEHEADLVACTGDYTALGTEPELREARRLMEPFARAPLGFHTVPGNHDVYLQDSVREAWFERSFGAFLQSDLPELAVDGPWPTVRLPAAGVAVVGVNSARPNPQFWRSSGRIPDAQLEALGRVFADARVRDRFVVVLTHYAPRLERGRPDHWHHGLVNAEQLLNRCAELKQGMLLHGHIHRCYGQRLPGLSIPCFGAGSATDEGREGLWLFDVSDGELSARKGRWKGDRYELDTRPVAL